MIKQSINLFAAVVAGLVTISSAACDRLKEKFSAKSANTSEQSRVESGNASVDGKVTPSTYVVVPVRQGTLDAKIELNGSLQSSERANVTAEKRILLSRAKVRVQDTVKKGQVLFEVDARELLNRKAESQERVQQSTIQLSNAKNQLALSAKQFTRKKALAQKGIISERELDEAERTYRDAQNNVSNVELELRKSTRELENAAKSVVSANFVAPIDGVVQFIHEGGTEVESGTTLARIIDPSKLSVIAEGKEIAATRFKINSRVQLQLEDLQSAPLNGTVVSVKPVEGSETAAIKSFEFVVNINAKDVTDYKLKEGYVVSINDSFNKIDNALVIPRSAIFSSGSERFAYFAGSKSGKLERRKIEIGFHNIWEAQITSGAKAGEFVAALPSAEAH